MAVRRDFATWPVVGIPVDLVPLTFAGTTSPALDVQGRIIAGVDLPDGFAGTTLTIKNRSDGTNYQPTKDETGAAVTYTVAKDEFLRFNPPLSGYTSVQFVSNASETCTITVSLMP